MSFYESFNNAGFRAVHWTDSEGNFVGKLMLEALATGRKLFSFLGGYNVFTQMDVCIPDKNLCFFPQSTLFELLYRQYPQAKFILNYRNTESHVKSINSWGGLRERLRLFDITDLTGFIEDHNRNIREFFTGRYNFLAFDIESDTQEKLSEFVGKTIKLIHINKSAA